MDCKSPILIWKNDDNLGKKESPSNPTYQPDSTKHLRVVGKQFDKAKKKCTREITPLKVQSPACKRELLQWIIPRSLMKAFLPILKWWMLISTLPSFADILKMPTNRSRGVSKSLVWGRRRLIRFKVSLFVSPLRILNIQLEGTTYSNRFWRFIGTPMQGIF